METARNNLHLHFQALGHGEHTLAWRLGRWLQRYGQRIHREAQRLSPALLSGSRAADQSPELRLRQPLLLTGDPATTASTGLGIADNDEEGEGRLAHLHCILASIDAGRGGGMNRLPLPCCLRSIDNARSCCSRRSSLRATAHGGTAQASHC